MKMKYCPQCGEKLFKTHKRGIERLCCPESSCTFINWNNPIPVVAGLVEHDGDIVLVQNRGWPDTWFGLVSGFLEAYEEPSDAIVREISEELGLQGKVISLIGLYSFPQMNQLIIAYHVSAHGNILIGEELSDIKRIPPERLKPWSFGTGAAVRDWLSQQEK
jgi:NADH pyrophosphatase NudC (nudix superfamily)